MVDEAPGQVRQRGHSYADAAWFGLVLAIIGVGLSLIVAMAFVIKAAAEMHWSLGGIAMLGAFFLIGFGSFLLSPPVED